MMAQKLFFAEWPWWLWGMLALASACVGLWMSWMRARQVSAEEMLTEETIVSPTSTTQVVLRLILPDIGGKWFCKSLFSLIADSPTRL